MLTGQIYIDLDGVLVNIAKGCSEVHCVPWHELYKKDKAAFWQPINEIGPDFWVNLEWLPGSDRLWKFLLPFNPIVLTACSRHHSCKTGKLLWIHDNLGLQAMEQAIICYRREKINYAKRGAILIDDYHKNISAWEEAGGVGLWFKDVEQTIRQIIQIARR